MKPTYADSGVLMAAFRGEAGLSDKALEILGDPNREFVSNEFVRLELLPQAVYHQNKDEVEFYETFFRAVKRWADISEKLVQAAYQEACRSGLSAIDALHVMVAASVEATELATTESPEKPIHRTQAITVISIL